MMGVNFFLLYQALVVSGEETEKKTVQCSHHEFFFSAFLTNHAIAVFSCWSSCTLDDGLKILKHISTVLSADNRTNLDLVLNAPGDEKAHILLLA